MVKKHLVYVHHGRGIGGAPISLRNLVKAVVAEGDYRVTVVFLFASEAVRLFDDIECEKKIVGRPYAYFNHTSRWTPIWKIHIIGLMFFSWFYTRYISAPKMLKALKPDVLHLNSSVLTDWSGAARALGIKNVVHIREAISYGHLNIRYNLTKFLLRKNASHRVFISRENMSRLDFVEGADDTLVYNPIGEEFDQGLDGSSTKEGPLKALFLGGLSAIKGLSVLVRAIPFIEDGLELHIGGHVTEEQFQATYPSVNHGKIKIVGLIRDVSEYMDGVDIMICPITDTHFCRPAVEASARGLPTIISSIEGAEEMVINERTGLHFAKNDPRDLADKINLLIRNRKMLRVMGEEARALYETKFAGSASFNKVMTVYNNLLI